MIGVLCSAGERGVVREFFELFKTPWEFFIEGGNYEVVISTLRETPAVNVNLVVLYSSQPTQFDVQKGITLDLVVSDRRARQIGSGLPIYGKLARFRGPGWPLIQNKSDSEAVVIRFSEPQGEILRVGYDLFYEVTFLLTEGQPVENALIPTLESHISLLRDWIVTAGIPLVEIPPIPWGHRFIACLTHDVDFAGIRRHKCDHTMWGFVYRAFVGSPLDFVRGNSSLVRVIKNWTAVFSLPLVYLGIIKDFWDPFERYAGIEKDLCATFFLIPFKNRTGDKVQGEFPARRATRYDIWDVRKQVENLVKQGFEIGLHGIDAWHSAEKGSQEMNRITEVTGQKEIGVRIHWLCFDRLSPSILEQAGFDYDSTSGYNETIGCKAGTMQVFRPLGVTHLLELPLHIQDTALFYPRRLALTQAQAWELCGNVLEAADRGGGVVTVLWHERSLAPERLWDEFYLRLLQELRARGAWFGTASQVVQWFRQRRSVAFEDCSFTANTFQLRLKHEGNEAEPRLLLRVHKPRRTGSVGGYVEQSHFDIPWNGEQSVEIPLR